MIFQCYEYKRVKHICREGSSHVQTSGMWPCIVERIWDLWICCRGLHVANRWGHRDLLFSSLSHTVSLFGNWLILSHRFTSPNKTCHSATVSTHTLDPALLTQPSFCLLNSTFNKHYPQWTPQTIPVTFSLSCGSSNHATHCATFQSTSQQSQFLTDPCVGFQLSWPFQTNDLWSTENSVNLTATV